MKKVTKAVILAAGLGTRMLPATKSVPKELFPIVDKPALQYIVEELVNSGIEDIMIIISRGKTLIEDHFDKSPELEERLIAGGDGKTRIAIDAHRGRDDPDAEHHHLQAGRYPLLCGETDDAP